MQFQRIDKTFREAYLSDSLATQFTAEHRVSAISAAIKEYSLYKPAQRRYGAAELYDLAHIGDTVITLAGGLFFTGNTITLSAFSPVAETVVIASVNTVLEPSLWQGSVPYTVTLTAPLVKRHELGSMVTPTKFGLDLISGQDTYLLPLDFLTPETKSFDARTKSTCSSRAFSQSRCRNN